MVDVLNSRVCPLTVLLNVVAPLAVTDAAFVSPVLRVFPADPTVQGWAVVVAVANALLAMNAPIAKTATITAPNIFSFIDDSPSCKWGIGVALSLCPSLFDGPVCGPLGRHHEGDGSNDQEVERIV